MGSARLSGYVASERERIVEELIEYLSIPSISGDPDHVADVRLSAEFTAGLMHRAGLENVALLGEPSAPAVYGDWLRAGSDAPTAVVYGHHDVQPVDPLAEWRTAPFDPVIENGECRARGAIDDKGQVLYELEAVRGLLASDGRLPMNVKFLIEGEEEIGSPHMEAFLLAERERLDTDVIVVSDTGMWAPDVPSICVGMRGLVAFDVSLRTAANDLHSGSFGGAVPNACHLLADLVSALHDSSGRVTLPGFYDQVRDPSEQESRSLAALPFDEERWMVTAGVATTAGDTSHRVLERIWTRPSCDVVGIGAGHIGAGMKTVVPAAANARVTFRLVADQDPEEVVKRFVHWVEDQVPRGVEIRIDRRGTVAPVASPVDHPAVGALSRSIEKVWGVAPLYTREGGSGPEETLTRVLGAPLVFLGVGLPGDRIHAPNERMIMEQFWKGLLAAGELWHELATTPGVSRRDRVVG